MMSTRETRRRWWHW